MSFLSLGKKKGSTHLLGKCTGYRTNKQVFVTLCSNDRSFNSVKEPVNVPNSRIVRSKLNKDTLRPISLFVDCGSCFVIHDVYILGNSLLQKFLKFIHGFFPTIFTPSNRFAPFRLFP